MKQHYPYAFKSLFVLALFLTSTAGFSQVYTVTSVADDGSAGTLRDAINQVNSGAATTINFDFHLLGAAPYTITLGSDLPTIAPLTGTIVINGYSEPASSQGTIASRTISVQINGNNTATNGLNINASNIEVSGLAIYSFKTNGIAIQPGISTVSIWGNFLGTDATGLNSTFRTATSSAGILIGSFGSATNNSGIIVGTNGDGVNDANEGNLVVANGNGGIVDGGIIAFNTTGSRFAGNIVGLGKDGTSTGNLFNNGTGILLSDRSTSNTIGTDGNGTSDNLERNFVSYNGKNGIWIFSKSNSNVIAGNVIGLTSAGTAAANVSFGIDLDNSASNRVGTNADGVSDALETNYISSNSTGGIIIISGNIGSGFDENTDNNVIAGNAIGVSLDGTTAAANAGNGIQMQSFNGFTLHNTVIGSDGSGVNETVKGNIIANSPGSFQGISIQDMTNTGLIQGTRISRNTIYNNGSTGINLVNAGSIGSTGVTPNQATGFSATGPNSLLNTPVITSISNTATTFTFAGFARPGAIVEFYLADKAATTPAPPSGLTRNAGQGKTFLFQALQGGTLNGITDGGTNTTGSYTTADQGVSSGASPITVDNTFSFTVPSSTVPALGNGTFSFTALAIDAGNTTGFTGNTSAFSTSSDATFTALPISLLDFSAHSNGSSVDLTWSTASETNNARFDIERGSNGTAFEKIGEVPGSLNSTTVRSYAFTDSHPLSGAGYYRLKQVDLDNKSSYSKVVVVNLNNPEGGIKIFPSAFTDNLNLTISTRTSDKLTVRLFDHQGRNVGSWSLSSAAGNNSFTINSGLDNLSSGAYFLSIKGQTISYTQQLIKL
jgi:hypothetical protein